MTHILWSDGTGSDVIKLITAPMVGGIITALFVVLVAFPARKDHQLKHEKDSS
ncbi:MAG: hypothetical protein KAS48_07500 [Gammaproteobacteria bacterium]|nr:hypothetical protein [Gammaproteobacteria bacterium]MCK5092949.1 hypothetical protein [Gammaproteobacteria bacterium]